MIDSILFSKTIPAGQASQLIDKIAGLSNIYFTNKMTHVSSLPGLEHTSNKQTLFNVGMIDDAISEKKQISFVYNNYGEDKKLDRKSTRLNSSHTLASRMPSSA